MTRRFQFSLRDLFWLVLVVAAFFGGKHLRWRNEEESITVVSRSETGWSHVGGIRRRGSWKTVLLSDGTEWIKPEGNIPDGKEWRRMIGRPSLADQEAELEASEWLDRTLGRQDQEGQK